MAVPVVELVLHESGLCRLGELLDEAILLSPRRLVVDAARCPTLDASAIEALVEAHRRMRRAGGDLVVRGLSARLRRNLALTRADLVLTLEPPSARAA